MKRFFAFALLLLSMFAVKAQDTVVVQTLTLDSASRAGVWEFPSDTNSWRQILMRYRMRCHDALVGNGNVGCREWDYSCNTVLTDSSRTDSFMLTHPTHIISNFSGSTFLVASQPTYEYVQYNQQQVTYTNSPTDTTFLLAVSGGVSSVLFPSSALAKTQILYTAGRLGSANVTAGELDGILLDMQSITGNADFLRIRIKHTSASALDPLQPVLMTLADEVYFLNTPLAAGQQRFRFHVPFIWNGTDNIVVEISYHNTAPQAAFNQGSISAGSGEVIQTTSNDGFFRFGGAEAINLSPASVAGISQEITVAFWAYGAANLPQNTTVFEGVNASGARHINVHLPWSDGRVYWDCGADAGGYDRIDLAVNANDYRGKWTHWAFTKNAATGEMKVFMNGTQVHSGTGKTKPIDLSAFRIGQALTGSMAYYGDINDFQVWSKALGAATIQAWMNKDITAGHPDYASLKAYFKLDETSGVLAADASPQNQPATVAGIPNWRQHRGHTLHRNFSMLTEQPALSFYRGPFTLQVTAMPVLDSVQKAMHQSVGYATSGSDLVVVDTNYYFQAGNQLVYDETGAVVDTVFVAADSTINIGSLTYYRKQPARYELISFVTPYGNGLDLGMNGVMWEFDVTDFAPVLEGFKRLSVEGVGNYQEELDIQFLFIRGTPPREVMDIRPIWPILGENDIWSGFQLSNILSDAVFEPRQVQLDSASASWKVRVAMTGHGQNGEFVIRWHFVKVNGVMIPAFRWQGVKECATIPVYPQGGTWLFDRAGWCPGDPTDLKEFELAGLASAGQPVTIDYGMDYVGNTSASDYRTMTQLVTYGPNNFNVDAAVIGVKRPNKEIAHARFNPACNEPVVILRNEGTTPLTSVDITYNQKGGPTRTFQWTGSLDFMKTEEVALPVDNPLFWTGTDNVFEVTLSNTNGGIDEQPDNNVYFSEYLPWDVFQQGEVQFYWRTNNNPSQSTWKLFDESGNIILQNSPFLTANTTYSEKFNLPAGCYTLRLNDSGDDGLYYWYTPSNGTGFAQIRYNGSVHKIFKPEFGRFIQYDFYTEGSVGLENDLAQRFIVYPNPSEGRFQFLLDGVTQDGIELQAYDATGRQVWSGAFSQSSTNQFQGSVDLGNLPTGTYWLRVKAGDLVYTKDLLKF